MKQFKHIIKIIQKCLNGLYFGLIQKHQYLEICKIILNLSQLMIVNEKYVILTMTWIQIPFRRNIPLIRLLLRDSMCFILILFRLYCDVLVKMIPNKPIILVIRLLIMLKIKILICNIENMLNNYFASWLCGHEVR